MKVKVRKRKPAPVKTEQISNVISSNVPVCRFLSCDIDRIIRRSKVKNEFDVPNHLIVDDGESFKIRNVLSKIDIERKMMKRLSTDRIPEYRFIEIIGGLHYKVHHPTIRNAKAKMYPNLTIQEYADFFGI